MPAADSSTFGATARGAASLYTASPRHAPAAGSAAALTAATALIAAAAAAPAPTSAIPRAAPAVGAYTVHHRDLHPDALPQ